MKSKILLFALALAVTFSACEKNEDILNNEDSQISVKQNTNQLKSATLSLFEDFESGSKGSYAGAYVYLSSGTWYFNDALLGTLSNDRKYDSKSVRIRNTGKATMKFDVSSGASQVVISHAKYGTNGSSSWELYYSTNGGSSWQKTGSTIYTSSTTLQEAVFNMEIEGNVRFEIRKISGGSNRINIDDFTIYEYENVGPTRDNNMALGNPSNAVASTSYSTNYLMEKDMYSLSYNNSTRIPNWVSWHLSMAWRGDAPRTKSFYGDYSLPSGWFRVTSSKYTGSGFDRGHMCPSADRNASSTDNKQTFYMTNIVPQSPDNNQKTWKNLEDYCRDLTDVGYEMYIIAGTYGEGGEGRNGWTDDIYYGNIKVPEYTWKIVVVLPVGSNDIQRINTSTRVIAVIMDNDQSVDNHDWGYYRTTVDEIENMTGYNFLSNVPSYIQNVIESRVYNGSTSNPS